MDRVPEIIWVLEIGLMEVERDFSSFLAYLMIFQSAAQQRCFKNLKNHQICQKFGKK